jgi:uncharacterized protein
MSKKTLVIGASTNQSRYSYMAINRLRNCDQEVVAIGTNAGIVADVEIQTEKKTYEGIHTVALYVNPTIQKEYYDYIISLKPKRIIFNPGTENSELKSLAFHNNIDTIEGCVLVMLGTGLY